MDEELITAEDLLYDIIKAFKGNKILTIVIGKRIAFSKFLHNEQFSPELSMTIWSHETTDISYDVYMQKSSMGQPIYLFKCYRNLFNDPVEHTFTYATSISIDTARHFIYLVEDFIKTPINEFYPNDYF